MGAKSFDLVRQGFNTVQVEEFLGEVRDEVYALEAENHRLKETYQSIQEDMERYREREHAIAEALVMAHKNAEDIVAEAKQKAAAILSEAQSGLQDQVEGLRQEASQIEAHVATLREEESTLKEKVSATLSEYIKLFETVLTNLKAGQEACFPEEQEPDEITQPTAFSSDEDLALAGTEETESYRLVQNSPFELSEEASAA